MLRRVSESEHLIYFAHFALNKSLVVADVSLHGKEKLPC